MKMYKGISKEQDLNPGRVFTVNINYSDEFFVKSMRDYMLREKRFSIGRDKAEINMTCFEIDAQVHAVGQAKRLLEKQWDEMTVLDLFYEYLSLRMIAGNMYKMGRKVYEKWLRDLLGRMKKQGLCGKKMRDFPDYKMIADYEIERMLLV